MSEQGQPAQGTAYEAELREAAQQRIKAKRHFWSGLAGFLFVWAICWVTYFMTTEDHDGVPWPLWLGIWGLGVVYQGVKALGPARGPVTEAEVEREMRRMQGR